MALAHGTKIVRDGLVLHLDAANPRSYSGTGTDWFDLSGNDNHGTLVNGPTFVNSNAGYFSFDGTDDYVDLGVVDVDSSLQLASGLTNGLTIQFFIRKADATGNGFQRVIDKATGGSAANGYAIWTVSLDPVSRFEYSVDGQDSNNSLKTGTTFDAGLVLGPTYQHFAITHDFTSGFQQWYKNGILGTNRTDARTPPNVAANLNIGTWYSQAGREWKGDIPTISVYNRALTQTEIQQNFNAMKGRYGL